MCSEELHLLMVADGFVKWYILQYSGFVKGKKIALILPDNHVHHIKNMDINIHVKKGSTNTKCKFKMIIPVIEPGVIGSH